jgi:Protein of unknwon function (DUF3310)
MSDAVNHPKHYNSHASGIEAIEICEYLNFCIGNAVKYLFRVEHKGAAAQDVQKSAWYLKRAIAGLADYSHPPHNLVLRVCATESEGSVLRDVLEALFVNDGNNYYARVKKALARVEREIDERAMRREEAT